MESNSRRLRQAASPVRVPLGISPDDWQSALAEAMTLHPGESAGKTTVEIVEACQLPLSRVELGLRKLNREGRLLCTREPRMSIDGVMRPIPVYSIKPGTVVPEKGTGA
jgi:hypothetical protein